MKNYILKQVKGVLALGLTLMLSCCLAGCGSVSDSIGQDDLADASEAVNAIEGILNDAGVTTESSTDGESTVTNEASSEQASLEYNSENLESMLSAIST